VKPRAAFDLPIVSALTKPFSTPSIWRRTVRLLRSIAARIDLSDFPPSCCG
jgi:hypothetical protein